MFLNILKIASSTVPASSRSVFKDYLIKFRQSAKKRFFAPAPLSTHILESPLVRKGAVTKGGTLIWAKSGFSIDKGRKYTYFCSLRRAPDGTVTRGGLKDMG